MKSLLKVIVLVAGLQACAIAGNSLSPADTEALLPIAESLIDDFYSFDSVRLEEALANAEDSKESLLYYQGWAEGGNYEVVERKRCVVKSSNIVSCPITVKDDPMLALGVDFFVTDTFEIAFQDERVSSVETSSNDLPIYYEARDWVRSNMLELIAEPCEGFFAGGRTPGGCARAMAEGYRRFAASDDFPNP
ncbi:MAG: hypothetical protein COB20_04355 [SAR86 cluster bacterium]|uniref:Uncharacterized protein n=1 Tax=SAR86 cluster bacterium TaxID=2030880 RepID=A0A2A4XCC1_9GAMM|nr:MAG: hypothetical protein COB20_04355 [SAR86 cluster bacterium]